MKNFKAHLDLLGFKVKDKVTGASGVVSSVSFDLYGCIQAVVSPPAPPEGEPKEGRWYDIARLEIIDPKHHRCKSYDAYHSLHRSRIFSKKKSKIPVARLWKCIHTVSETFFVK